MPVVFLAIKSILFCNPLVAFAPPISSREVPLVVDKFPSPDEIVRYLAAPLFCPVFDVPIPTLVSLPKITRW